MRQKLREKQQSKRSRAVPGWAGLGWGTVAHRISNRVAAISYRLKAAPETTAAVGVAKKMVVVVVETARKPHRDEQPINPILWSAEISRCSSLQRVTKRVLDRDHMECAGGSCFDGMGVILCSQFVITISAIGNHSPSKKDARIRLSVC